MEKQESSLLKIDPKELDEHKEAITSFLKQVSWVPDKKATSDINLNFISNVSKALNVGEEDEVSILKEVIRISGDRIILSNTSNLVLNAIRTGFCLGKHIAELYAHSSGLELLQQKNSGGTLHQSELPEFHDKSQTQSAVLLFVAASFIEYSLKDVRSQEVSSLQIDFGGIPQVSLSRPSKAIRCSLYYYAAYLERSGIVTSDLYLLKITQIYFERLIAELNIRQNGLKYAETFTLNHYKLEGTEFVVQGFEHHTSAKVIGMQFNKVEMHQIVANKEAKHMFKRYADRLMCYDFEAKKNPMLELGGLPSITMADGKPGTGKSMLIAATATLLQQRCDQLGYNFLFWPLPENIVSTFQGGTAERAIEWFKPMQDPNKIVFAPIDDAENNLEERTRQGVSAGVREFIGVFLRNTEGAYAVNLGNRLISLFTNIPDQIDKAVLSRIQIRIKMEGASNKFDFIDQDYMWWKKYQALDNDFVNSLDPKGYNYLDAQKPSNSINDLIEDRFTFTVPDVEEIYNSAKKEQDIKSQEFFGVFYSEVLKRYPFFSSRDLRNIQKAVDARLIDFDLPEVWWDNPNDFFTKDYDSKLLILKDLMKKHMRGASFTEIRLYEALNYVENAIRVNQTGIKREIKERAKQLYIQEEAGKQLLQGNIHD
jgi:hypothetical protein